MKAAFIVNPLAGRGKAGKIWKELEPSLKIDCPYQVYYTEKAGDAVRLACRAQEEGAAVLVSVGGDGTVHEIVNGMNLKEGTLGLIPAGTGNDFCRSLGYPRDPFEVAERLFLGQPPRRSGEDGRSLFCQCHRGRLRRPGGL